MNEYLIALFEQQLKDDPKSRVFLRLAEEYRKGSEFRKAVETCQQGLIYHPNYLPALVCLGRCRWSLGHADEACETFQKVLALAPDNSHALRGLGLIFFESGRLEKALAIFESLALLEPGDEDVQQKITIIQQRMKQPSADPAQAGPSVIPPESVADQDDSFSTQPSMIGGVLEDTQPSTSLSGGDLHLKDDTPTSGISNNELVLVEDEDSGESGAIEDTLDLDTPSVDSTHDFEEDELEITAPMAEVPGSTAPDLPGASDPELLTLHREAGSEGASQGADHASDSQQQLLQNIDHEFEKALKEASDGEPLLFDETGSATSAEPSPTEPAGSMAMDPKDEALLTIGLKHEQKEHFEESLRIYQSLLAKYPGHTSVVQHLDRLKRSLARETVRGRKIRLLSNMLDRIKGVYHVS